MQESGQVNFDRERSIAHLNPTLAATDVFLYTTACSPNRISLPGALDTKVWLDVDMLRCCESKSERQIESPR